MVAKSTSSGLAERIDRRRRAAKALYGRSFTFADPEIRRPSSIEQNQATGPAAKALAIARTPKSAPLEGRRVITAAAALGIATVAFGMVVTPGPNMMYLVSRTLTQGRPAGLVSLAGVVTGFLVYLLATSLGLAVLFSTVPALFIIVKLAGAAYLLWLAWTMVRGRSNAVRPGESGNRHSIRRLYAMGMATCLLNPKIALLYVALLPQFIDPERASVWLQTMQLGAVQIVVAAAVNGAWVVAASQMARALAKSRSTERVVRLATGGLLAWFAVHLGLAQPARP